MWLQRTNTLFQRCISSNSSSSIRSWQHGVKQIEQKRILTPHLGGNDANLHLAWYGDKILGASLAKFTLDLFQESLDRHVASKIASVALSNRFLQQNVSVILPDCDVAWHSSAKETGTMIEAAISQMPEEKIDDLAKYLVKEAMNELIRGRK